MVLKEKSEAVSSCAPVRKSTCYIMSPEVREINIQHMEIIKIMPRITPFPLFLTIVLCTACTSPAASETHLPDDVSELVYLPPITPVPKYCVPTGADAKILVLSRDGIIPVHLVDEVNGFSGFFDVDGFFLLDSNRNGAPEAYGFGMARTKFGGAFPANIFINNKGETVDLSSGEYAVNFRRGISMGNGLQKNDSPSIVIEMSEWECRVSVNNLGDVVANN